MRPHVKQLMPHSKNMLLHSLLHQVYCVYISPWWENVSCWYDAEIKHCSSKLDRQCILRNCLYSWYEVLLATGTDMSNYLLHLVVKDCCSQSTVTKSLLPGSFPKNRILALLHVCLQKAQNTFAALLLLCSLQYVNSWSCLNFPVVMLRACSCWFLSVAFFANCWLLSSFCISVFGSSSHEHIYHFCCLCGAKERVSSLPLLQRLP